MPLYTYRCPKGHTKEILDRYEMAKEEIPCLDKVDCGEIMYRELSVPAKAYVNDVDLIAARGKE